MDEYNVLANKTRNLEQEYISQAFKVHSEQIAALKKTIVEYKEKEQMGDANTEDIIEKKLRSQLRVLEDESKENKAEIKRLRKENTGNIEQLKVQVDIISEAENKIKFLEEENNRLLAQISAAGDNTKKYGKKQGALAGDGLAEQLENKRSYEVIASLSDKQDQILRNIENLVSLREEYRARIEALEEAIELHKSNENKSKEELCKLRGSGGNEDAAALRQRIVVLERENSKYAKDAYSHEKNEKLVKEQKDTIVLLRDSISVKDKAIERLTAQVERLKKSGNAEINTDSANTIKPQRSVVNIEDLVVEDPSTSTAFATKGTKKAAQSKPSKAKPKLVNVDKLIKEENNQFFNNLSFTNSSPMPDKKTQRK